MELTITSRKNPLLQQVKKLLSSRKAREEAGLFVGDGTKLLAEAVRYCPGLDTVIASEGVEVSLPETVRLVRVPEDVMASISPMETPQGALFLCRMPEKKAFAPQPGMLLLDGLQDPGNLGTKPVQTDWETARRVCRQKSIPIGVTALSSRAKDLRNAPLEIMAVVIGSEGRGVRQEILDSADDALIIPMNPHCESLNAAVAATIVMWQMKQRY